MKSSGRNVARNLPAIIIASVLATTIGSCGKEDPAGPPADGTAPTVAAVTPTNAAQTVRKDVTVTAQFSEAVNAATVTTATFLVRAGTTVVAGTITLSTDGLTATFTPAAVLASGTDMTATIRGGQSGVADLAGNRLAADFTWTFRVNALPVAAAGPDRDVTRRSAGVTLDGSASDADGQTITFSWTQVSGPSVGALTGATPNFAAPDDVATLEFELVVSDGLDQSAPDRVVVWVLDDATKAVWVSPTGNDTNAGTRAAPKGTILSALDAAVASGGDVYVAAGTYTGSVGLRAGVGLYGGFHTTSFVRDVQAHETVIAGGQVAVQAIAAHGAVIDGFTIRSASGALAGSTSTGVLVSGSTDVVIARNRITSGDGVPGNAGVTPAPAANGGNGANGGELNGGGGGSGGGFAGGRGGNGSSLFLGKCGSENTNGNPGGGPNGGGGGQLGDQLSYEDLLSSYGKDGGHGGAGANGNNSNTGGQSFGVMAGTTYTPSDGGNGANGSHGSGGGGGGGADCYRVGLLYEDFPGAGGGGGGAGGAGRIGSSGGKGGGASFGILLSASVRALILGNTINTGIGGQGGAGGNSGTGGLGGTPGSGESNSVPGGVGGSGGRGGWGGAGAGGGGGPSIGVLEDASSSSNLTAADLGGNIITPGLGGLGGAGGVGPSGTGTSGASGTTGLRTPFEKRT